MKNFVLFIIAVFLTVLLWEATSDESRVIVYDCSLAEISPDYPISVRQECRRLQYNKTKDVTTI
jgi:hypothetical protein